MVSVTLEILQKNSILKKKKKKQEQEMKSAFSHRRVLTEGSKSSSCNRLVKLKIIQAHELLKYGIPECLLV